MAERLITGNYLSAPIPMYGSPTWLAAVARLQALFPGEAMLDPLQLFRDRNDWQRRLPSVLRTATRLVFLTDAEDWIGRGVDHEIRVAVAVGCPIVRLGSDGTLVSLAALALGPPNAEDWVRYRRVGVRPPGRAS